MDKKEKINRLEEISKILKSEFVGLDDIIDQILKSVSPWYVTPEIITRPLVISLWGMTGTGKTSVIRRLVELMGVKSKTMFVDCGEVTSDNSYFRLADKINDFIDGDENESPDGVGGTSNIFVFDEFQYARTLDEAGNEVDKSNMRPVWTLLDSGKLDYSEWIYGMGFFKQFVADFSVFAQNYPDTPLVDCVLSDRQVLENYVNELGYFFYGINPLSSIVKAPSNRYPWEEELPEEEKEKLKKDGPYQPLNLLKLQTNIIGLIYKGMNRKGKGEGKEIVEKLYNSKTLLDFKTTLEEISSIVCASKVLDCSRSIVFIVGNLDEAFQVEGEVNPDMNADVFNDITSKVTIHDIKESLGSRFRAEQVARLGNNLIKYPTLRSNHFRQIIEKELESIFKKFEIENGIEVGYGQDIIDLAYSEGVFPTQGVRPIFTTISSLLTPILSDIILNADEEDKYVQLSTLSDYSPELGFRIPDVNIRLGYGPGKEITVPLKLQLGALRYPKSKKRRFSTSVHEIGHAILSCWCTGNVPVNIVSVSTDDGGFCDNYDPKHTREIPNKEDVKSKVMICQAGYLAESLVFGEGEGEDKILLGSGHDLMTGWNYLAQSVYRDGFLELNLYGNVSAQAAPPSPIPGGYQLEDERVQKEINRIWRNCKGEVIKILIQEKKLLKEAALVLSEKGCIEKSEFEKLISLHGNKLNEEYMKAKRDEDSWYYDKLISFN